MPAFLRAVAWHLVSLFPLGQAFWSQLLYKWAMVLA